MRTHVCVFIAWFNSLLIMHKGRPVCLARKACTFSSSSKATQPVVFTFLVLLACQCTKGMFLKRGSLKKKATRETEEKGKDKMFD